MAIKYLTSVYVRQSYLWQFLALKTNSRNKMRFKMGFSGISYKYGTPDTVTAGLKSVVDVSEGHSTHYFSIIMRLASCD